MVGSNIDPQWEIGYARTISYKRKLRVPSHYVKPAPFIATRAHAAARTGPR
ncbi:hypothetical protein MSKU9_3368 [Komagataeibacter diospyri]|uniref:Uncharacterized protein n=1 Tax=Komagataeibacter diospyri TaxID=1932662 RepID=A0A4P5NXS1_9PROT|nr:hypothetical protein MSKU9_3368 [Komagataeibacter diospyri]